MSRQYESTAVMLRPDQLARLREIREITHMPMSVMHRQAVDEWIARWDEVAPSTLVARVARQVKP